ncbi:hypothetical protein VTN00DRAFT_4517 [Thermoascus crustaceus]|uniref:uncharacterized protein n=1 Tax=Thermoascus crustaceus TaxID=5088 RepID=UPI0037427E04
MTKSEKDRSPQKRRLAQIKQTDWNPVPSLLFLRSSSTEKETQCREAKLSSSKQQTLHSATQERATNVRNKRQGSRASWPSSYHSHHRKTFFQGQ